MAHLKFHLWQEWFTSSEAMAFGRRPRTCGRERSSIVQYFCKGWGLGLGRESGFSS